MSKSSASRLLAECGRVGAAAWIAAAVAVASPPRAATAQVFDNDLAPSEPGEVVYRADVLDREYSADTPLMNHDGRYIVVHLAENRVFVFEGGRAIWSAPSGTGTGLELQRGERHQWKFTTPEGIMRVRRMEKNPMWEAPDWHFIEKNLPIPPQNDPRRLIPGGMGTTALYLGDGIAIHGTEKPELLMNPDPEARRVSHGCIRLTNEHARELMHMVEVGTPVLIYGYVEPEVES